MKIHNFSAGPGILPAEVLQEAAQGVLNYQNTSLSLIEMSHRGAEFIEVMEQAVSLVRELFNLNNEYEVLPHTAQRFGFVVRAPGSSAG